MGTDPSEVDFLQSEADDESTGPREMLRQSLITGAAIILPVAVTLVVLGFVVNFVSNTLGFVTAIQGTFVPSDTDPVLIKVVTLALLFAFVLAVGFLAEFGPRETNLGDHFDDFMASIPGLGSVYTSFDEMSELLLDSDTESFQEVKLVEYPTEGSYVVAFKTAETPPEIEDGTGYRDMMTMFMPMAPNPVMGGFVIHVSKERVHDVDMTVEEGIRSIVTSGVAVGEGGAEMRGLSEDEMRQLGYMDQIERQTDPGSDPVNGRTETDGPERAASYDEAVSPEYSDTPQSIVDRTRTEEDREETEVPPDELGRDADDREVTTDTPAEMASHDDAYREPTRDPPGQHDNDEGKGDGDVTESEE